MPEKQIQPLLPGEARRSGAGFFGTNFQLCMTLRYFIIELINMTFFRESKLYFRFHTQVFCRWTAINVFKAVTRNITLIRIIFDNLQFHDSIVACKSKAAHVSMGISSLGAEFAFSGSLAFLECQMTQLSLRLHFAFLDFWKFINL